MEKEYTIRVMFYQDIKVKVKREDYAQNIGKLEVMRRIRKATIDDIAAELDHEIGTNLDYMLKTEILK